MSCGESGPQTVRDFGVLNCAAEKQIFKCCGTDSVTDQASPWTARLQQEARRGLRSAHCAGRRGRQSFRGQSFLPTDVAFSADNSSSMCAINL